MLDIVPAQLRVKVIRRPCHARRAQGGGGGAGTAPGAPDHGRMATEALLAHVLVAKYADFLPLPPGPDLRLRKVIELDRSTLCDWVGRACWWLERCGACCADTS